MITFCITKTKNLDIYRQFDNLNEYNSYTKKNIDMIEELLSNDIFEVPYYKRKLVWGEEIVFAPFTDKLFKIVSTKENDTSIQLHPKKNEIWYPLKKSFIFTGNEWLEVDTKNKIFIPKCSIHCMKKNGIVFEVQDNNIFDKKETLRIYDINGRDTDCYFDYVLPHNLNNLLLSDNKQVISEDRDIFIFIKSGTCLYENKELKNNILYFVKKNNTSKLSLTGNYIITVANYLEKNEFKEYN